MAIRRLLLFTFAALIATGSAAGAKPATVHGNKPPPVTKLTCKLDSHQVTEGTPVTGSVVVQTRDHNQWIALADASLSIQVDGTEVMTVVTDAAGSASVSYSGATVGDHVMKFVYAGDDTHKRAQRAQGFEVTPAS